MVSLYAPGNDILVAEFGTIYAGRDAITQGVRQEFPPGTTVHSSISSPHVAVLSRDAVVVTGMVDATFKDSAGVETPMRFAWTGVFVRVGAEWKLQVEHASLPPAPAAPTKPAGAAKKH